MIFAIVEESTGIQVLGDRSGRRGEMLTAEALEFLAGLQRKFDSKRRSLLRARSARQERLDQGELPDFLAATRRVREGDWKVAAIPADLQDRRVEITGPADRKMIINALNSGASVFMADLEDSNAPSWANTIDGQVNLFDAVRRSISFETPAQTYTLADRTATLIVRPRGWHLEERHVIIDGDFKSASLFDFGLYFFHNASELGTRGTGPYFYLPKMESHLEARLWNDVFTHAQKTLGIPLGTIRATVLIETILAAFEMDEILYELRDHSAGLNCGRWDYIFSFIKKFRSRSEFVLPDRALVTMDCPFLRAYVDLLIRTCHRRGIHAMGGMAAQIPIRNDAEANAAAMARVEADKQREVRAGHDGTWVAHPGLVPLARNVFDAAMPGPNQIDRQLPEREVRAGELLEIPEGEITERGMRQNINVGLRYLEAWLGGLGCVPINNLMEDAATAEICRTQLWQWIRHGARLSDGRQVTRELYESLRDEELLAMQKEPGERPLLDRAVRLFDTLITAPQLEDFLTQPAYRQLLELERNQ